LRQCGFTTASGDSRSRRRFNSLFWVMASSKDWGTMSRIVRSIGCPDLASGYGFLSAPSTLWGSTSSRRARARAPRRVFVCLFVRVCLFV
jgi:hypothetical protein